jgi:hypothetical protein
MNFNEFNVKMNPLINRFKKGYNGDVLALVFEEVKNITMTDFERLVTHLLGSSRIAPMVPDFRKAINDLGVKSISLAGYDAPAIQKNNGILTGIDWEYPVKKGVWANSRYFFFRDGTDKHRFMVKSQCVDSELLELDQECRKKWVPFFEKITAPGYDGKQGSYNDHLKKALVNYG